MRFILLFSLISHNGISQYNTSSLSAEFHTKEACEKAAQAYEERVEMYAGIYATWMCVEKYRG